VRVILTGGGTGGHIYPALSVAACLHGDDLLYVGTAEGPESEIVPRTGLEFRSVPSRKLARGGSPLALAGAVGVSALGVGRAIGLLREWRPDVVLGTGGYASAAVMFAAGLLRIPTVIHEANAVPGRVNQLLARLCTRVAVTYAATQSYFPASKTVVTGMPVRPDLLSADPTAAQQRYGLDPQAPVLLISGGSGGAQTLNRAVVQALPLLDGSGVQVVHQTGKTLFEGVRAEVPNPPAWYHPLAYVEDMPSLLAAATLLVCRAGSSTLAEVTALGRPAIAVPYPFAVADHQTGNARALADAGAAILVKDAELTGERLHQEVTGLLADPARLTALREKCRAQGNPDSARVVAELVRNTARPSATRVVAAAGG
jgi:UDP-N-acetylglucosamine--N-acetylmuramyl-(pentapeptide) pyrophosphoryl-undecaprenol N-acetylglucosamine transferase